MSIHPTAIISEQAEIHASAEIGPFCVVEGRVTLGPGCVVESHARIGSRYGQVDIGENNLIQCGAVLGGPAQDYSYANAATELRIGAGNRFGEHCSINLGTSKGGGVTRIGNRNLIMAYAHVGHDCQFADDIVLTNGSQLAGHVIVERNAFLSGLVGATQFVRFGACCFVVAGAFVNKDIAPYTIAEGHWAVPKAPNRVGLKRAGFNPAERKNIYAAVRILLDRSLSMKEVAARISEQLARDDAIDHLLGFLSSSDRGLAR